MQYVFDKVKTQTTHKKKVDNGTHGKISKHTNLSRENIVTYTVGRVKIALTVSWSTDRLFTTWYDSLDLLIPFGEYLMPYLVRKVARLQSLHFNIHLKPFESWLVKWKFRCTGHMLVSFRISAASAVCVDLQGTLKYKIYRIKVLFLRILSVLLAGLCSERYYFYAWHFGSHLADFLTCRSQKWFLI